MHAHASTWQLTKLPPQRGRARWELRSPLWPGPVTLSTAELRSARAFYLAVSMQKSCTLPADFWLRWTGGLFQSLLDQLNEVPAQ